MKKLFKWLTTNEPGIVFEDSIVGRLKKEVWEASDAKIEEILWEYDVPSPPELGLADTYIQTTNRMRAIEKRRENDIVFVPIGCTENHGLHANSGLDTFMCTGIVEALRRYTAKRGRECSIAFPPLNYGGHPHHHVGMPGTVIMPEEVVKETLIYTMLGLWNDGYRKILLVNNHGHLWMLESSIQEFCKRFQLPGIFRVIDWHRAIREFFVPIERKDSFDTTFIHADEIETSMALLLFPAMLDMSKAQESWGIPLLPDGHIDVSVDAYRRPSRWSEGQGHSAIELKGTPEGVVGNPKLASAEKAKRPMAAILKYLTLLHDEILEAFPSGKTPDTEYTTLRTSEELAPYLKEPLSEGWKTVYAIPKIGAFEKL
jgi:creatinine amidohydrolase